MTRKKLYLLVAFSLCFVCIFAQQISQEEALLSAKNFYGTGSTLNSPKKVINHRKSAVPQLKLVYTGGGTTQPDYYIYNVENKGGFVIVAGDERVGHRILFYSLSGNFNPDNIPPAFQDMLDEYSESIKATRKLSSATMLHKANNATTLEETSQVGPLLGNIMWHQESPYNALCPMINGKRTLTGCGATAAAQVMKYHQWPLKGIGAYTNSNNGGPRIDFSQHTYNWNLILPTYNSTSSDVQKSEVAKLVYHVGYSFNMKYNLDGSGTGIKQIPSSLWYHFSYSRKMQVAYRLTYSDDEWFNLIKREIDLKRPVVYSGLGNMGGHLFICDGYDSDGRLHFNYGWEGGYLSGFAFLSSTIPGDRTLLFPSQNAIILGIHPNNITVADKDEAYPQIAMISPLHSSTPSVALGTAFKLGARVANYNAAEYSAPLAIALYKGTTMVGQPLVQKTQTLKASSPAKISSSDIQEYDIVFDNIIIPKGTADGTTYKLRLLSQLGSLWIPAVGIVDDVVKDIDVTISNGTAKFNYPTTKKPILELIKPIEVAVSNNRAVVKFAIRNSDDKFLCKKTDIAVLVNPDNSPIPTVFARATIDTLYAGLTQDFVIKDVSVAPGANVKSCRFYVAYSPVITQPAEGRDITFVPMVPSAYNFSNYQIPKEELLFTKDFTKDTISSDYKVYNKDGTPGNGWRKYTQEASLSYATYVHEPGSKLVTPAIKVDDENCVFEWRMQNRYSETTNYILYVTTEGQDSKNFITPVYNKPHPNNGIARISLSEYAGKNVYIAFEGIKAIGWYSLMEYKMYNIKTPKDISIQGTNISGSALAGQTIPVKILVKNHSSANVKKINAYYTVGTETVNEVLETDIPFNETVEVTFQKPIVAKGIPGDIIPIKIHIQQDGEESAQLSNNDATVRFMVVNFFPKKGLLAFKSTKIGCGGCMLVYSGLDSAEEHAPDEVSAVELWRDGNFKASEFSSFTAGTTPTFYLNGVPKQSIDYLLNDIRYLPSNINPPANIAVEANYADPSSRKLKIKIWSNFASPVTGNYKLGAIIIENNVRDIEGQISGPHPTGEKLVKNHLPIGTIGGSNGATGFLISNPKAQTYTYECEYTIPDEAMSGGTSYRYRKDNIQVIAVLYGPNGEILNSALDSYYLKLPETTGLTFFPVEGSSELKRIYDLKAINNANHESIVHYRATMPVGTEYKFKIEKDASWNNRNFKLMVNTKAYKNTTKEELLLPDENGVYTIDNAQKHYTIELKEILTGSPTVSRNGTEYILSGTWTTKDFQALRLNYNDLTSVDMTNITIPSGVGSLDITNPNALIYTKEDAVVPASWNNVVKGSSAVSISLKDGYPFFNTHEFEAQNINYYRAFPYPGWGSVCLPFAVSTLPEGIVAEEYTKSIATGVLFTETASTLADTPYILHITQEGEKLFSASNVKVSPTNLTGVLKGNYSFEGTYSKMSGPDVAGLYIMNFDGAGFRTTTATNDIPAFRSYVRYTGSNPASAQLKVSHMEAPTGIDSEKSSNELVIRYIGKKVELITMRPQIVNIHGIDGCLVKVMNLNEGANPVNNLPIGVYLVEGKKIIIK